MYEEIDSSVGSILDLLFRIKQFKAKINSPEFSHGEMVILYMSAFNCKAATKELSPSYISESLNVSRPTVTSALNSLENKGYIKRESIANDRRKTSISITKEGREFLEHNFSLLSDMVAGVTTGLGEEKTEKLIELITESVEILERNKEQGTNN